MMTWLAETQLSPSERFISAVKVGALKITVAVRSVSEEGFDSLPWAQDNGIIGNIVAEGKSSRSSHRPAFEGKAFKRSAQYTAFSLDENIIWTPAGAFDLVTGEKTPLPECCADPEISCATWSGRGQRLACLRAKKTSEVYENDGRLTATFHSGHIVYVTIADFSKSGRYELLLEMDKWRYSIFDLQQTLSFYLHLSLLQTKILWDSKCQGTWKTIQSSLMLSAPTKGIYVPSSMI
jgi:hypothetical protein